MARIIEVARLIHSQPRKWTRPRLAERFEVNKATIQRDIDLLRDMGIVIVPRGKQGYEMISDFFLPTSILTLRRHLHWLPRASFYRATEGKQSIEVLDSAIHKITSGLPKQTNNTLNQIAPQIEVPRQQVSPIDEAETHKEQLIPSNPGKDEGYYRIQFFQQWKENSSSFCALCCAVSQKSVVCYRSF